MADSALSSDPLERYSAIEQAYCEERWMAVIHDGQSLLTDLDRAGQPPAEGLKERLQLLIGHAYLYGLGDRDSAEDHYQEVLRSGVEASLRQIAEQGLQQCVLPVAPAEVEDESPDQEAPLAAHDPGAAAPSVWQEGSAGDLATAAVIPAASQDRQENWEAGESPTRSPEQAGSLGWLTAAAPAASPEGSSQPVMPWLESASAAAAAVPRQPEPAADRADLSADQGVREPVAASSPPPQVESWSSPAGATLPTESPSVPVDAAAAGEQNPDSSASAEEIAADVAAAFQRQWGVAPVEEPTDSLEAPPGSADSGIGPAGTAPDSTETRLVPDVVEEPELIELHLATAQAEEVLVHQLDGDQPEPESALIDTAMTPAAGASWRQHGGDRRGGAGEFSASPQQDPEAPQEAGEVEPEPARDVASTTSAVAASPGPRVQVPLSGGPFSAPPEPVAEEDAELLMGLLKVEMG